MMLKSNKDFQQTYQEPGFGLKNSLSYHWLETITCHKLLCFTEERKS